MKKNITVYQQHGPNDPPEKHIVEAWCVAGDEGILAFFTKGEHFYIAGGDDGHWWVVWYCHKDWIRQIKKVLKKLIVEI